MCSEGKKEVQLAEVISDAAILTKKVKKLPPDKKIYIKAFMNSGDDFYVSGWSSREDVRTGEKLILFVTENKTILTDFRNVQKIEFYYEKPSSKAVGFEVPAQFPSPAWQEFFQKITESPQGESENSK